MRFRINFLPFAITALCVTVWGFSFSPADGRTGDPDQRPCTDCLNSFRPSSGDGSLSLLGTPTVYVPDSTYPLTVILSDPGQSRWGFELAVKEIGDQQTGTITLTDPTSTQSSNSAGSTYLEHDSAGICARTKDGPVSWTFSWTTRSSATGIVNFYIAGNTANNNGNNQRDYIYNINRETTEQTPPGAPPLTPLGYSGSSWLQTEASGLWLVEEEF